MKLIGLLKEKVSFEDLVILIYHFGLSVFNSSKKYFATNNIIVNETILFINIETIISTLFAKELNRNEIMDYVNKIVYEAFEEKDRNNMISYYIYIKDEIYDLINNHIHIKDLVDYMLNEITNKKQHNFSKEIVAFLCDVFNNVNNEIKNIVSNIKIKNN